MCDTIINVRKSQLLFSNLVFTRSYNVSVPIIVQDPIILSILKQFKLLIIEIKMSIL